MKTILPIATLLLAPFANLRAADFFVAPAGDDANPGTEAKPFATVQRAQQAAAPGDTVLLRGGIYRMTEAQIAKKKEHLRLPHLPR